MSVLRQLVGWVGSHLPGDLSVFVAAIFLSNGVNVFTTIYAVPGRPVHSVALWCSCVSSLVAAALWTGLSVKKESIEKAALSGAAESGQREAVRANMWDDVWGRVAVYLVGAIVFSGLAMLVLVVPVQH